MVFKVMDKVFLLTGMDDVPLSFNVKCDPDIAEDLREKFDCVTPGFHMNKKHWNTIIVDNSVSEKLLFEWIDDSYNLIVSSLNKAQQKAYSELL
jgi:predicted DNA-binding protein (MmcQ/YjbR family)